MVSSRPARRHHRRSSWPSWTALYWSSAHVSPCGRGRAGKVSSRSGWCAKRVGRARFLISNRHRAGHIGAAAAQQSSPPPCPKWHLVIPVALSPLADPSPSRRRCQRLSTGHRPLVEDRAPWVHRRCTRARHDGLSLRGGQHNQRGGRAAAAAARRAGRQAQRRAWRAGLVHACQAAVPKIAGCWPLTTHVQASTPSNS